MTWRSGCRGRGHTGRSARARIAKTSRRGALESGIVLQNQPARASVGSAARKCLIVPQPSQPVWECLGSVEVKLSSCTRSTDQDSRLAGPWLRFWRIPAEGRERDRAGGAASLYGLPGEDRVAGETLGPENQAEIIWKSKGKRGVIITPRFLGSYE